MLSRKICEIASGLTPLAMTQDPSQAVERYRSSVIPSPRLSLSGIHLGVGKRSNLVICPDYSDLILSSQSGVECALI